MKPIKCKLCMWGPSVNDLNEIHWVNCDTCGAQAENIEPVELREQKRTYIRSISATGDEKRGVVVLLGDGSLWYVAPGGEGKQYYMKSILREKEN